MKYWSAVCRREKKEMEPAGKPGSVVDNHSSGMRVATHLERPTRKRVRATPRRPEGRPASLFGLASDGVYLAAECCHPRGALLPHRFTLAGAPQARLGGLLSVALSVGSRPPGVTWRPALRSPDFPLRDGSDCLAGSGLQRRPFGAAAQAPGACRRAMRWL